MAVVDLSRGRVPSPGEEELGANQATHGRGPAVQQPTSQSHGQPVRATDGPVGGNLARERVGVQSSITLIWNMVFKEKKILIGN